MWDSRLTPDILFFFDGHADALVLYEALAEKLLAWLRVSHDLGLHF